MFNTKAAVALLASTFLVGSVSAAVLSNHPGPDGGMAAIYNCEKEEFCEGVDCPKPDMRRSRSRRLTEQETEDLLNRENSNLRKETRHLQTANCPQSEYSAAILPLPFNEGDIYAWAIINACSFQVIDYDFGFIVPGGPFGASAIPGTLPQDPGHGPYCVDYGTPVILLWFSNTGAGTVVFHEGRADSFLVGAIAGAFDPNNSGSAVLSGAIAAGLVDGDAMVAETFGAAFAEAFPDLPPSEEFVVAGGLDVADYPNAFSAAGSLAALGYTLGGLAAGTIVGGLLLEDGEPATYAAAIAASFGVATDLCSIFSGPSINCLEPTFALGATLTMLGDLNCNPETGGDPHFKTWSGHWYDFHGECDLVAISSHELADTGLDMSIHLRTKGRYDWSFIESLAVNIGEDVLEVSAYGQYFFNGVESARLPNMMGDKYPVTHTAENKKTHHYEIKLGEDEHIHIKTVKDIVSIQFNGVSREHFGGSLGLMGEYGTGKMLGRDGATVITDPVDFGMEWQINPSVDGNLFQGRPSVEFPSKCSMPDPSATARRLAESGVEKDAAAEACKNLTGFEFDNCVYDVMAMGDLEMAGAGAF